METASILEHLDEMFPIVRASQLKVEDSFIRDHKPIGWVEERVMNTLLDQIPRGLEDFRHPKVDPSFDSNGKLVFKEGVKPGVGVVSYKWKEVFESYLPEKHSRMETDVGYDIFCGVLIKEMVESGYNIARAWYEVCYESCKVGYFWDSRPAKSGLEGTGSRPFGEKWCDLGNTRKIITNANGDEFFMVSGSFKDSSQQYSIASKEVVRFEDYVAKLSVGLMRMDV